MTNKPHPGTAPASEPTRDPTAGVYGITTAAELVGMSVQALRLYERRGLIEPARTTGGTRRYSETDLTRLRRISELIDDGINLAGIARVLGLEATNADLHSDNAGLRTRNTRLENTNSALRSHNSGLDTRTAVPLPADHRTSPSDE